MKKKCRALQSTRPIIYFNEHKRNKDMHEFCHHFSSRSLLLADLNRFGSCFGQYALHRIIFHLLHFNKEIGFSICRENQQAHIVQIHYFGHEDVLTRTEILLLHDTNCNTRNNKKREQSGARARSHCDFMHLNTYKMISICVVMW